MATFFYQFKPDNNTQFTEALSYYFDPYDATTNPSGQPWPTGVSTDTKVGNINENPGYIENWNTIDVTDMSSAFAISGGYGAPNTFNRNIMYWDTSNVTTMTNMFNGSSSFNQNVRIWTVTNVGTGGFDYMFTGATAMDSAYTGTSGYGSTPTSAFFGQPPLCVIGSTKVLMADGTQKEIQNIKPGDEIMEDIFTKKTSTVRRMYKMVPRAQIKIVTLKKGLIGNDEDIVSTEHPIWINDDKNRIFPSNIPGAIVTKGVRILYDIQYETEGTFYANGIKVDSLPPNCVMFKLPYELYENKDNYHDKYIYTEDDEWRCKPKMTTLYSFPENDEIIKNDD